MSKVRTRKDYIKHGLSGHPAYPKWRFIYQCCYLPTHYSYKKIGGKGIKLDWEWHPNNPFGLQNFIDWVAREMTTIPKELQRKAQLTRKDRAKNYGPENCHFVSHQQIAQKAPNVKLTARSVIMAREMAAKYPRLTAREISQHFTASESSIYKAITGQTWKTVDQIMPPVAMPHKRST